MTPHRLPLSAFRRAWRDLQQETRRKLGPVGFTRPALGRSPDGQAVVIETWAAGVGADAVVRIEVPLAPEALRLPFAMLDVLRRLDRGELRRSATMTGEQWRDAQAAARLGLVSIRVGDGWEAEATEAGREALRRGWIP